MGFITRISNYCKILIASIVIMELLLLQEHKYVSAVKIEGLRHRPRMRAAKIRGQIKAENMTTSAATTPKDTFSSGKYEIRSVSGEPDYKSVNLTWEVEFVPASQDTDRTNSSNLAVDSPPKAFQIFFCELQSFGPHRCRSKLVNESSMNAGAGAGNGVGDEVNKQLRQYSAQIDNLRMATKYSFHIRPQAKFGRMKISARSGLFDNEIEDVSAFGKNEHNLGEQTIVIPTKGFSAQATKCLPHASEIEVETGPYFGGKIVVDGGNCGVKGNPSDPQDKYTMRIDHKMCGSLVKQETNTVETFITVQENLGIFTHSTRRFVVVCSFQSGMQTVRASFTVPGRDGMASALENDPFQPDEQTRLGREQRHMRYVDKSALVLKEPYPDESEAEQTVDQREVARVQEVVDPALTADSTNSVAILEDIVPGVNENDIKHENNVHSRRDLKPLTHTHSAKYAKLVLDPNDIPDMEQGTDKINETARAYSTTLHHIAGNIGSMLLTVSLTVIIIGVLIFIAYREAQRRRGVMRQNLKSQEEQSQQQQKISTHLPRSTLPRSSQIQQTGTM